MFLRKCILRGRNLQNCFFASTSAKITQESVAASAINLETKFPPHEEKKPKRRPFAKNLFIGKFDTTFLTFPEAEAEDRYKAFFEWLNPIEMYISGYEREGDNLNKETILSDLAELGLFRGIINDNYNGLNLSEMELLKLVQTLSRIPWLGIHYIKNNIIPVNIISKYGSEGLKKKYYPRIMNGEVIPTLCILEEEFGINFRNIKTEAVLQPNGSWTLNGKKALVVNGSNSNLFLVFARCKSDDINQTTPKISLFLVQSDFSGVTCSNAQNTSGRHSTPVCTVTFNNTIVPKENVIDETDPKCKMLLDVLIPGQQNMAGFAIGILKAFIDEFTLYILEQRHFNKYFYEFDAAKQALGKITSSLYGMESVAFLTAGIMDEFEAQDVQMEKAITEKYCANECVKSIFEALQVIGTPAYLEKYPFMQYFKNSLALTTLDTYNIDTDIYIGSLGIQHAGKHMQDDVQKARNPKDYPMYAIKSIYKTKDPKLFIKDFLHLSLTPGATTLEDCVHTLRSSTSSLFVADGSKLINDHPSLCRLSEMVTQIYVCTAVLARASRSYCIGLRNSEKEKHLAANMAILMHRKVKAISEDIDLGPNIIGDQAFKEAADITYQSQGYFLQHPLNRTS